MPNGDSTTRPRRSPRFLPQDNPGQNPTPSARRKSTGSSCRAQEHGGLLDCSLNTPREFSKKLRKCRSEEKVSDKRREGFEIHGNLGTGLGKSPGLGDRVEGFLNLRRSPRISEQCRKRLVCEHSGVEGLRNLRRSPRLCGEKGEKKSPGLGDSAEGFKNLRRSSRVSEQCRERIVGERSGAEGFPRSKQPPSPCSEKRESVNGKEQLKIARFENFEANEDEQLGNVRVENFAVTKCRRENLGNVAVDLVMVSKRDCGEESSDETSRKRKMDEWTEEQELALQRAYLVAKATPSFWKKVAKLVPGKSAQDCFNKLTSDYETPPLRQRASTARRKNASPIPHFDLSASEVLKPNKIEAKKPRCNKQKRHNMHKNARHLLKEHYHHNQVHEADLFSVLEPNSDFSTQPYQLSTTLSTPKSLHKKKELLQTFNERSSSGAKRPLSRFSGSPERALVSPPVLKQVKNRVLHEKYIDQLHNRDAKRETESKQLKMGDGKKQQIPKVNVVRAAKNALVSDARDAITMLRQMQAHPVNNSSDSEDNLFKSDGDESEIEM